MMRFLLFSVFSLNFIVSLYADPFATLVSLKPSICGSGGSVEFELNGDPDEFTYYWEHGPTVLQLDGLKPGTYTFVVINSEGCKEEYPIEILEVVPICQLDYQVVEFKRICRGRIALRFLLDGGGVISDPSLLIIEWDDGYVGGLERWFSLDQGFNGCVTVSLVGDCCEPLTLCIDIPPSDCRGMPGGPTYGDGRGLVIVNEVGRSTTNRGQSDTQSFIELLVLGNGVCGDYFDISGYILDDNNGALIHGNELVTESNAGEIGINKGYLTFNASNPIWKKIPNGSLIVIQASSNSVLMDDYEDSNHDYVYIVPADDANLFSGHAGKWVEYKKTYDFGGGTVVTPSMSLVAYGGNADGVQVRTPSGELSHAISCGESAYSGDQEFKMWLSEKLDYYAFTGVYWFDKEAFTIPMEFTPGKANSELNESLITGLTGCNGPMIRDVVSDFIGEKDKEARMVSLFPNPTEDILNVQIRKKDKGQVSMRILDGVGQVVLSEAWGYTSQGIKTIDLAKDSFTPGWYLVEFEFADGSKEYGELVIVKK